MIKFVCKRCGNATYKIVVHAHNIGIYCDKCDKYYKFLNKTELLELGIIRKKRNKNIFRKLHKNS